MNSLSQSETAYAAQSIGTCAVRVLFHFDRYDSELSFGTRRDHRRLPE